MGLSPNAHDQEIAPNPAYTLERTGQRRPLPSGDLQLQRLVKNSCGAANADDGERGTSP